MAEYSGIYLVENCVAERKRGKIMNLLYKSTRNSEKTVTASEAILKGLADDGGLFVPESIPKLDVTLDELKGMSYQETAYAVMKQFFTDFTEEELKHCINSAYDSKFDTEVIAPFWYITPAIVFGNELFFTLFSTTAATATCPAYGSPLASLYTVLASRFKLLLLVLLLEFELPLELNIPIASSVFFPAIPSTVNPFFL